MWWQVPAVLIIIALIYVASKGDEREKRSSDYKNEDDEDYVI